MEQPWTNWMNRYEQPVWQLEHLVHFQLITTHHNSSQLIQPAASIGNLKAAAHAAENVHIGQLSAVAALVLFIFLQLDSMEMAVQAVKV